MKNFIKYTIGVLMLTSIAIAGDSGDWTTDVKKELKTISYDIKEFKAEAKGEDLKAGAYEAMDKAEELRIEVSEKLKELKKTSGKKAEKLKKEINTALNDLRKLKNDILS